MQVKQINYKSLVFKHLDLMAKKNPDVIGIGKKDGLETLALELKNIKDNKDICKNCFDGNNWTKNERIINE